MAENAPIRVSKQKKLSRGIPGKEKIILVGVKQLTRESLIHETDAWIKLCTRTYLASLI